ncbi:MAG: SDR family NAD(P)-dependent oxidoreductase [Dehalococcoidales bacterium]|nr:SDR family NAD(P)-dependent oxidoreductase [Dehalococcoidales bacterium]
MDFKGKVAVVTGAASGIGRSVALAFAKLGTDVAIADIDDAGLKNVRKEIESLKRRVIAVHCDVSKDDDVNNLAKQAILTLGKVDILMNNAGVGVRGYLERVTMADWQWTVGINLFGVIRGVHAFLPHMLQRGSGYIINTGSAGGLIASEPPELAPTNIPYITSKHGVTGFSEAIYGYLRPKGIMVSLLCPGMVDTKIGDNSRYVGSNREVSEMKGGGESLFSAPGVMSPDDLAQMLIKGMNENKFLIITHQEIMDALTARGQNMKKLEEHLQETFKNKV